MGPISNEAPRSVLFVSFKGNYSGARSQNSGVRMKRHASRRHDERKPAKDFQDLIVWQKIHQFVLSTYHHLSDSFLLLLFWILAPDF